MKVFRPILIARLAIAALATTLLAACSGTDTIEWKEEVLLHDGRMIVIERKAKAASSGFPNANRGRDLEFELHYKPMDVHWKGTQQQSTFEIFDGVAYLAVAGPDEREVCKDKPPSYIPRQILKYQGKGQWVEIDQADFPIDQANYTLYQQYWGNKPSEDAKGLVTWKHKSQRYPATQWPYHDSNNIPRRPYKFREFFEKNGGTCASFQQP